MGVILIILIICVAFELGLILIFFFQRNNHKKDINLLLTNLEKLNTNLKLLVSSHNNQFAENLAKLKHIFHDLLNNNQISLELSFEKLTQNLISLEDGMNHRFEIMKETIIDLKYDLLKIESNSTNLKLEISNRFNNFDNNLANFNSRIVISSSLPEHSFISAFSNYNIIEILKESSLKRLNAEVLKLFPDGSLGRNLQIIDSIQKVTDREIIWRLTDEGKRLLKTGEAELVFEKTGQKLLPTLRDIKNKKWIKQIRGEPAKNIGKLSKFGNLIINTAHIISAADLAQKIKVLDKKVNYLIEGRRIDKLGKLESNYRLIQQIFLNSSLDRNDCNILTLVHRDLMELRSIWRQEIEYKLKNIDDPKNKNFFIKMLTSKKHSDQKIYEEITEFELEMLLIDFSIGLDILICDTLGSKNVIKDDLESLTRTKELLISKVKYLSGKNDNYTQDLRKYVEYFNAINERYQHFGFHEREEIELEIISDSESDVPSQLILNPSS